MYFVALQLFLEWNTFYIWKRFLFVQLSLECVFFLGNTVTGRAIQCLRFSSQNHWSPRVLSLEICMTTLLRTNSLQNTVCLLYKFPWISNHQRTISLGRFPIRSNRFFYFSEFSICDCDTFFVVILTIFFIFVPVWSKKRSATRRWTCLVSMEE